jgi:phosphoglycolate phosphatase
MIPAILFDLDGTLIDTPSGIVRVFEEVLAQDGRVVAETDIRATVGRPLDASFGVLLDLPADSAAVARAVTRFRDVFRTRVVPGARELVFPGVPALLTRLRAAGHQLAIVTSKVETSAREILTSAGLMDEFEVIVCHGMAPLGKPNPDLALLAADRLGRSPGECVVVGDSVDDVRMALAAGMPVIGVACGVSGPGQLRDAGAVTVVDDTAEIPTVLATPTRL